MTLPARFAGAAPVSLVTMTSRFGLPSLEAQFSRSSCIASMYTGPATTRTEAGSPLDTMDARPRRPAMPFHQRRRVFTRSARESDPERTESSLSLENVAEYGLTGVVLATRP